MCFSIQVSITKANVGIVKEVSQTVVPRIILLYVWFYVCRVVLAEDSIYDYSVYSSVSIAISL